MITTDKDVILPMLRRLVMTDVNVIFLDFLIIRMFTHVYACFYGTANAARGSPTMLQVPGVCSFRHNDPAPMWRIGAGNHCPGETSKSVTGLPTTQ